MQEDDTSVVHIRPIEGGADRLCGAQADRAANHAAEHVRHRDVLEPDFEGDDEGAKHHTEREVRNGLLAA